MPNVLFVSQTAEKGGAELFLVEVVKAGGGRWNGGFLGGDGPAAADLRTAGLSPVVLAAGARLLGVKRAASLSKMPAMLLDLVGIARRLAVAAKPYDVLCANSQKALFVCAIAATIARKPLVWCLHDILTDPDFSRTNRRAAILFSRLFARAVVVNSQATGTAFVASGGAPGKVRLAYNGFDVEAWLARTDGDGARLREDVGLDRRPIVGVFSRLSEWKGQHVLLEAMRRRSDVQAVFVGAALFGEDAYARRLQTLVDDYGLADRVRFLGFRSDVGSVMRSVDIVAHTSTAPEPFGRVVVEGMLSGKPVIAAGSGGVPEIIRDGETGLLVEPGDATALSDAIGRLVDDPDFAATLARAGQRDAAQRFSLTNTCDALEAVFHEVTGTGGTPGGGHAH